MGERNPVVTRGESSETIHRPAMRVMSDEAPSPMQFEQSQPYGCILVVGSF
jgi:hypothetical protein